MSDVDHYCGIKEQYFDVYDLVGFLNIDSGLPDAPKIIDVIKNWEE